MNIITRDSKGRFMSKAKKEGAIASLGKKTLKVKTDKHLQVYSKKTIEEKTSSIMRPGAEVILDFLEATAPTGEQIVRVRKDGSTRTFYTTDKLVQEVIS
jgi:hypothetical protein